MAKVWAVREGDRIRIDGYGFATVSEPCEVPAEVAAALVADMALAQATGKPVRLAFEAPTLAAVFEALELLEPETPAAEPETPAAEPETPAAEPESKTEEQAPPAPARSKRGRATPQEE